MPTSVSTTVAVAVLIELVLIFIGAALTWRRYFSAEARAHRLAPLLPAWEIRLYDFLLSAFVIVAASVTVSAIAGVAMARFELAPDTKLILGSAAFQFGLLLGALLLPLKGGHGPLGLQFDATTWKSGVATFLVALPIVTVVNLGWVWLLTKLGVPVENQDLVRLFRETHAPALLALLTFLAVIVAPLAEELLFRATLFRYLRTRIARPLALLLPGTIFAALHVNWQTLDGLASFAPLVTLAVIFSLAYERSGRIGTSVIAHALFNANTLLLLLAGVTS